MKLKLFLKYIRINAALHMTSSYYIATNLSVSESDHSAVDFHKFGQKFILPSQKYNCWKPTSCSFEYIELRDQIFL